MILTQLKNYACLMRLHKPIGIFLLLWPTLWALWLAAEGKPDRVLVTVFVVGVILMRSAGCVINDVADRRFDRFVERTRERPLVSGKVSVKEALMLFVVLLMIAFLMALTFLNPLTIQLAVVGALLAIIYPFLKRITHLPQVGLGIAFAFGVPMAFAAELNHIPGKAWVLFLAAAVWPVIYDTYYAMVDRVDDLKIGVKSTAILFGRYDRLMVGCLQVIFLSLMGIVGWLFHLKNGFWVSLLLAALLMIHQQRINPFKAFLNNHWIGLVIFIGIVIS